MNMKKLKGIQYQALKIIYKEHGQTSKQYLHDLSGIESLNERIHYLASNYIQNAILNKNELIIELLNNITYSAHTRKTPLEKIGFNL